MSYYASQVRNEDSYERQKDSFKLTDEETRILKECSKEGLVHRALPLTILFGLGGYMAAKAGPLMHSRFGTKPAVIGLSFIGYYVGRISYGKICFQRALEVPDGNLRKMFPNMVDKYGERGVDSIDKGYVTVDTAPPTESIWDSQHTSADIDVPSASHFDTTPSDYYVEIDDTIREPPPRSYTTYDELRKQNRQEYTNKFYSESSSQQTRYSRPQERPMVRRPTPEESQPGDSFGRGHRTKYGDEME